MCPVVATEAAYMWATNEKVVRNEIRLCSNVEQNFVMIIALVGRPQYAALVQDLADKQKCLQIEGQIDRLKDVIKEQFMQQDVQGKNWKSLGELPVDGALYNSNQVAKQDCMKILQATFDELNK